MCRQCAKGIQDLASGVNGGDEVVLVLPLSDEAERLAESEASNDVESKVVCYLLLIRILHQGHDLGNIKAYTIL
jgi:hypothetical protein